MELVEPMEPTSVGTNQNFKSINFLYLKKAIMEKTQYIMIEYINIYVQ